MCICMSDRKPTCIAPRSANCKLVGMSVGSNGTAKGSGYLKRIAIKSGGRVIFLNVRDIDWIEAAGVDVYLHVGPKTHLYRTTVRQLQAGWHVGRIEWDC